MRLESGQAQYADGDGLYAQNNSAPSLYECLIEGNGSDGIECKGSNSFLIASNSKIRANADHGIYLFQADADGLYAGIDF